MVSVGIDAHERTHTVVAVDGVGRELGQKTTTATTSADHLERPWWAGALTAAKLVAETADVRRFRSTDAFARHNGTAPLPVWSGNRERHRLSRTGNRQLNDAIHRIAITQMRGHDDARASLERRITNSNTNTEALRALERRLSDIVDTAVLADPQPVAPGCLAEAAAHRSKA